MYKICVFLIVAAVFLSVRAGAEEKFLEVYTFKKDRVDQEVSGNRGYIMGEAPEQIEKPRNTQRTLIGVDIMVGVASEEDDEDEEIRIAPKKQMSMPVQRKSFRSKDKSEKEALEKEIRKEEQPIRKEEQQKKEETNSGAEKIIIVEETEEEWIK